MCNCDKIMVPQTESMSESSKRLVEIMQGRAKPAPKMALGKVFEMRCSFLLTSVWEFSLNEFSIIQIVYCSFSVVCLTVYKEA